MGPSPLTSRAPQRWGAWFHVCLLGSLAATAQGAALPSFDFTLAADRQGWQPTHDIANLQPTSTGMVVTISGADPYLNGPPRDYPAATPLWVRLRLLSSGGGNCQLFYYQTNPTEPQSVTFAVPAGSWVEGRLPLPALGPGFRFRIDPPGVAGRAVLAALRFEERALLPDFDFATLPDATGWQAAHDISALEPTLEGLRVRISGGDPYLYGPARDYPSGKRLWLRLRLRSDQGGMCQVFYFTQGATEENSVRFSVPPGDWHATQVPLPALGNGCRLRIDPPGSGGECLLGRLWFEERVQYTPPQWPRPQPPVIGQDAPRLRSGDLELLHSPTRLGAFEVWVAEQKVALGNPQALAAYLWDRQPRWFALGDFASNAVSLAPEGGGLLVTAAGTDPDGARWKIEQRFAPGAPKGIEVETTVTIDQDREVLYLPPFTLLPGVSTYGTNKTQGLFAGVEYLENEPSSSEADLNAPDSWRQVPDTVKITFPLMALQADGRYVGLVWEPQPQLCALFDSPDRQFGSGGHLMGLLFPGSDGVNREQRSLLPYRAETLRAGQPLRVRLWIIGGQGETVVPAVQDYVALRGLPPVPDPGYSAARYCVLAAHGWLDSKIRETNLFRHAYWPGFGAQPAADAATWMLWLSQQVTDLALGARLTNAAAAAIAQVSPPAYNGSQVGHVRYPLPALVFGAPIDNANQARSHGQALLGRFQPDGTVLYQPSPNGLDYGRTHWARHANGLTASVLAGLLEAASFSGDRALWQEGLRLLQALDQYRHTVPRGAQTWEIPLHTPDILAAGYLVRAYTLGYEFTGDRRWLEQARYWAWTGVPFLYLHPPTSRPVGLYNTIPVLGATAWVAPCWIGLPVQWCGLVYGEALYGLAVHDPAGPWRQLADGIAVGGVQHTWPETDVERQGLLPDSYQLRPQLRDGPAINPATVQAPALRYYRAAKAYDSRAFRAHGLWVHAPGPIHEVTERADGVTFRVSPWSPQPSWVLVNGFRQVPRVRLNGLDTPLAAPHRFQLTEGRLALRLTESTRIELWYPTVAALRIVPSAEAGGVDLVWPASLTNAVVEHAFELSATSVWAVANALVYPQGGWWVTRRDLSTSQQFFRLRFEAYP